MATKISNHFVFTPGATEPWESKFGGEPYVEIAQHEDGEQKLPLDPNEMGFICQINLADLKDVDCVPKTGLLQIFSTEIEGDSEMAFVYLPTYITDKSKLLLKTPYSEGNVELCEMDPVECKLSFKRVEESDQEWNINYDAADDYDYDKIAVTKIGGYCNNMQGVISEATPNLLQFRANETAGIFLGDDGLGWVGEGEVIEPSETVSAVGYSFFYACY